MTDQLVPAAIVTPAGYVAWRRQRVGRSAGKWGAVAEGQTERECAARLFAVMDQERGHHDSLVLPAGQQP